MIAAGSLRHRLTLERMAREEDGSGGAEVTWIPVATLWGSIETLSGRESFASDAVAAEASHRITIRYRDDVGQAARLRRSARVFAIAAVNDPDGRKRRLVCH